MSKTPVNFKKSDEQDLALLKRIKDGDKNAFTEIFNKYHGYVYHNILKYVRKEVETEDIVMEIFQKVYENVDKYKKRYTFNAWITQVAKNYLVDKYRKSKMNVLKTADSIDEPVPGYSDDDEEMTLKNLLESDAPEAMEGTDAIKRAARLKVIFQAINNFPQMAIQELSEENQEIFHMRDNENMNLSDIAEELGISTSKVKAKLRMIRNKLKQVELECKLLKYHYVDGLSYDEISRKFYSLNFNTMKVTLFRGKKRLIEWVDARKLDEQAEEFYTVESLDVDKMYNQ